MNSIKNIFQGMSSWVQLLFLGILFIAGLILTNFITIAFSMYYTGNMDMMQAIVEAMKSANLVRVLQFIQQILAFILPAFICVYLFQNKTLDYLKINKLPDNKFLALSIALIIVIQPIISFTSYYNQMIELPESLSWLENWMRSTQESNDALMELLLTGDSITTLLVNLFIIAFMAGLSEELFFRGALQQVFNKITTNYHIAVWITAFIFSAIHMQYLGFVPRLLLGAILGYLFVWSGNLWIPIVVHFFNNAMSVLLYRFYYGTEEYQQFEEMGVGNYVWLTVLSVFLTGAIISFMYKDYIKRKSAEI